jgi:hypothetical protein
VTTGNGDYAFATEATDRAGNVETLPTLPAYDSVTQVNVPKTSPSGSTDTTPPTVSSVVVTKTLTGLSTVTFSEPVQGLTPGGAAIVLTDTSTVVPTAVTCLSGTSPVTCSGTFSKLQLRPYAALVPGQHYTIRLLAGAVKDLAGNALVPKSVSFRGSLVEQERSRAAHQTWRSVTAAKAYGGSFVREAMATATATWRFTGTRVTWWTVTGPNQGRAAVWIDGHFMRIVNNYSATTHYKVARTFTGLGNKAHVIRIVVRGEKGATAGTGTFVSVDAFTANATLTRTPALTTTWRVLTNRAFSDGHAMVAGLRGEAFTFVFRGTGIAWFTQKASYMGKAAVYVDGVYKGTVDNYAARVTYAVKRAITGLTDKVHTLRIVVLHTHRATSTNWWVVVDKLRVS